MIKDGVLKGVEEIYGLHNASFYEEIILSEEGDIRICAGPMMAGACSVKITVKGKGGHGSFPERVNDPITAAC